MFDLIDTLTIQQILDLGFECTREGHSFSLIDDEKAVLKIAFVDKTVWFVTEDALYSTMASDMIIKMVKLGYIVENKKL